MRANRIRERGTVSHRHEATPLLEHPGDFVFVYRGVMRSIVLSCPDGCGDTLTINLDGRTDKAWRFYRKRDHVSVFPSVWRDTGCGSHFIVWNQRIFWCDLPGSDRDVVVENAAELRRKVLEKVTTQWQHYTDLAQQLDEVPWDVNWACSYLAIRHLGLEEGIGKQRGYFRKA